MKQTDHLRALGQEFQKNVFPAIKALGRTLHMVVLDDEADDASVLDANVEMTLDPLSPKLKQIPRAIADLWDPRAGGTPNNLFTTYVGYTATPQANFLQQDQNPLSPRDFVVSLRTPLDIGEPLDSADRNSRRSSTYPEPTGLDNFYTGGEVFYRRGEAAGLSVEIENDGFGDAIRAFLVAGAIRLNRSQDAQGPFSLVDRKFSKLEDVQFVSPSPHSMLIHPSSNKGSHFTSAEDVLIWAGVDTRKEAREMLESENCYLPSSLIDRMYDEMPLWEIWLERYQESLNSIVDEFNVMTPRTLPDWKIVKNLLESEIIPGTRISVVNSDESADDRPEYDPVFDAKHGCWLPARDISTIFVSGNVMSRGLTLEGLSTVYFQRGSRSPYADTQMQMQRWFGYRGAYIELCRLFAEESQIDLFKAYHDVDEALRQEIAAQMSAEAAPSPLVLHGMNFLATGKIADINRTPLCPNSKPFITLINDGAKADPNSRLVAELFNSNPSAEVRVGKSVRGRALQNSLSLEDAADLLSSLRYDSYKPGNDSKVANMWSHVQSRVDDSAPLSRGTKFYDAPSAPHNPAPARLDCPYAIAAYFRLWAACLTRAVRGFFITGAPSDLWSMTNLQSKTATQPQFTVGIRYGSGSPIASGPIADLPFDIPRTMKRHSLNGDLESRWGAHAAVDGSQTYLGDEFFDYYHRNEPIPEITSAAPWRPPGSNGQILFYINQLDGQTHPTVAVAICIPAGGPEQIAATRARSIDMGNK
ncbi:Z1 domain-containing protein [Glutamicibacter mishrai]|uniref:Z1 domain-containing protein n=1 Tax=Glutamicibacter mishrai TaxID=1775880 RepID=UPI003F79A0B0